MDETLKTIVTVVGLLGGTIALIEKLWKGALWVFRDRSDRSWAKSVHQYLGAPQVETPEVPRPRDAAFFYSGGHDDPERRCIVHATRERAAQWGVKQGFFLSERDKGGGARRRRSARGHPGEAHLEALRRRARRHRDRRGT